MLSKLDDLFVDHWQRFYTWWSVWLHTIGTTAVSLLLLVPQLPNELKQFLPVKYQVAAIALWYIGGLWARLKTQKGKANAGN